MQTRVTNLFGIDVPIIQAPMAGSSGSALAIAVAKAGALGSLPCAMLSADAVREEVARFRSQTGAPLNLNFFAHTSPHADGGALERWALRLAPYYSELGVTPPTSGGAPARAPFDEAGCNIVEEFEPEIVSFHFGLPASALLQRVFDTGAKVISSATTVDEAIWLEDHGCDAVIAQGLEAGGHRAMFLTDDLGTQVGTMALVPQIRDAVSIPVIAAGGIADARGVCAAMLLGADAVQIGTAYLRCPESIVSPVHRRALDAADRPTVVTNLFTGRPARGFSNRLTAELGPIAPDAPPFPLAADFVAQLRREAEARGCDDYTLLSAGQSARLATPEPAAEVTRALIASVEATLLTRASSAQR